MPPSDIEQVYQIDLYFVKKIFVNPFLARKTILVGVLCVPFNSAWDVRPYHAKAPTMLLEVYTLIPIPVEYLPRLQFRMVTVTGIEGKERIHLIRHSAK
jgi:hypothetical protein